MSTEKRDYTPEFFEAFVVGVLPEGKDKIEPADLVKTTKPSEALTKMGMTANQFYQVKMKMAIGKDASLSAKGLPERRIVQGSKKFESNNFFKNSDEFFFKMIAEDIENGDYVPMASEPNVVQLPNLYIKGFFAKATAPFSFYLTKISPDGKVEYLMSTNKSITPDGRINYGQVPATNNEVKIFVAWESDDSGRYDNVQRLLQKEIDRMKAFEVKGSAVPLKDEDLIETEEEIVAPPSATPGAPVVPPTGVR